MQDIREAGQDVREAGQDIRRGGQECQHPVAEQYFFEAGTSSHHIH